MKLQVCNTIISLRKSFFPLYITFLICFVQSDMGGIVQMNTHRYNNKPMHDVTPV